jgi:hypothetical protein
MPLCSNFQEEYLKSPDALKFSAESVVPSADIVSKTYEMFREDTLCLISSLSDILLRNVREWRYRSTDY